MRRIQALIFVIAFPCVQAAGAAVCGSPLASVRTGRYVADPALHRRWAVVMDCGHPERPWTLEEVPWQKMQQSSEIAQAKPIAAERAVPLIPAGAKVRLWRNHDGADIELSATALEAGAAGQLIHVRTGQRGVVLEGRVRGAGSVELLAPDGWQHKSPEGWSER